MNNSSKPGSLILGAGGGEVLIGGGGATISCLQAEPM